MAGSFTTTEANAILTAKFKTQTNYVGLFTVSPGDAGAVANEVANLYDYVRKVTAFVTDAAARAIGNTSDLTFDVANGGDWETVTHIGFSTSVTWQDPLYAWGPLTTSKLIENGDQIKFATGNITITFAAGTG